MKTKLKVAISTVSGYFQDVQLAANTSIPSLPSYSMHTTLQHIDLSRYLVPTRQRGNAVGTRQRPFPATRARCSRHSHADASMPLS